MRNPWDRLCRRLLLSGLTIAGVLATSAPARAGKVSWLDDVVKQIVRETEAGSKTAAKGTGRAATTARSAGKLFAHEADESLEVLAKRSDDVAKAARRFEEPAEALLETRFGRLVRLEPEAARTFKTLAPAEKRLVVEMGETAQRLARRYPGQAEGMIRKLGSEGMSAVRVYGDDVAEVIVKEGPETVGVLRKTGRSGWKFFTERVLPNKKKLAAAGVLTLFLANPDQFIDATGKVTEFAVRQFAKAGVQLAGAVSQGAARGLESAVGQFLESRGVDSAVLRKLGMGSAALVILLATMVLLGLPVRWFFRPLTWPFRAVFRLGRRPAPWSKAGSASRRTPGPRRFPGRKTAGGRRLRRT